MKLSYKPWDVSAECRDSTENLESCLHMILGERNAMWQTHYGEELAGQVTSTCLPP